MSDGSGHARSALEQQLEVVRRLQEVSTQLIQANHIQALYETILDTAVAIMRSEFASIQMFHRERGELRLLGFRGFTEEATRFWEWVRPGSQSACGEALRTRERVVVEDVTTCAFMSGTDDLAAYLQTGIRSVQTTPLLSRTGETIGMISTHWRERHRPDELDLRMLDVLARQAADLIDRKLAEEALRESDRRKTEFLAVLSHELRNPLAPIRNAITILGRVPPDGDLGRRAREVIERQTQHLGRLVDDLLDISRITRGKIELKLGTLDAREVVRRACADARGIFEHKRVDLLLSECVEQLWIEADAARVAQMVGNLLHNALKFTPAGGEVRVGVRRRGGLCQVSVGDTGLGIEPEDLERIFEPFVQSERTRHRQGGMGIGLALVRELATRHGGTVRASSRGPGKGSEFVLELPLASAPRAAAGGAGAGRQATGLSVLIVEDNSDAAETLRDVLGLSGHRVSVAGCARSGMDAVAARPPDVLICDIGLPDASGYEVIRAVRSSAHSRKVFAIALTGYAQPQDRDATLAAGFDAHLPKPPPLDQLEALLRKAARAVEAAGGAAARASSRDPDRSPARPDPTDPAMGALES